ncbi:septal ring lytic transglycosylase RlpA family protein [Hyphobacterium sp. CCMP332]|nr:septal ring lytic transglycosylase RlpA family protein [Hyphobacterium sp. CCMP332]
MGFNIEMRKVLRISFFYFLGFTTLFAQNKYSEKGIASYYADKFDGRTTASGEVFRNSDLTAAHRTLAFGTIVKVTNLSNGKSVLVRINDRGPYAHGRTIDLSKKAAAELNMLENGLAEVQITEVIQKESRVAESIISEIPEENSYVMSIWGTKRKAPLYGIQLASFESEEAALKFGKEAYENGIKLPLIKVFDQDGKTFYRIMAGDFNNIDEASRYLRKLEKMNYSGFVKTY